MAGRNGVGGQHREKGGGCVRNLAPAGLVRRACALGHSRLIFLGVMFGRERLGPVRHTITEAWNNDCAILPFLTARALSLKVR